MTARGTANLFKSLEAASNGERDIARKDALTTELENGITIDTCYTIDTGFWETAVRQNGHWYVPEDYEDKAHAYDGHQRWIEDMTKNPNKKLKDIHYNIDEPAFTLF